jgi:hypothetical protein
MEHFCSHAHTYVFILCLNGKKRHHSERWKYCCVFIRWYTQILGEAIREILWSSIKAQIFTFNKKRENDTREMKTNKKNINDSNNNRLESDNNGRKVKIIFFFKPHNFYMRAYVTESMKDFNACQRRCADGYRNLFSEKCSKMLDTNVLFP